MRFIVFIFLLLSVSCQGQENKEVINSIEGVQQVVSDTLNTLVLKGSIYQKDTCKILHLSFKENLGDKIQLLKNGNLIANLSLPIADIEVKNLTVGAIKESKGGFSFLVQWGGGNDFYSRNFHFEYKEGIFYLGGIGNSNYNLDTEKETTKEEKILPIIRIDELVLSEFIKNK